MRSVRISTCLRMLAAVDARTPPDGVSPFASSRRRRSLARRIGVSGFFTS